jgi:hypothetical protein
MNIIERTVIDKRQSHMFIFFGEKGQLNAQSLQDLACRRHLPRVV